MYYNFRLYYYTFAYIDINQPSVLLADVIFSEYQLISVVAINLTTKLYIVFSLPAGYHVTVKQAFPSLLKRYYTNVIYYYALKV